MKPITLAAVASAATTSVDARMVSICTGFPWAGPLPSMATKPSITVRAGGRVRHMSWMTLSMPWMWNLPFHLVVIMPNMFFMPRVTLVPMWVLSFAAEIMAESVAISATLMLVRALPSLTGSSTFSSTCRMFTNSTPTRSSISFMPLATTALSALVIWASDSTTSTSFPRARTLSMRASTTTGSVVAPVAQFLVVMKFTFMRTRLHGSRASLHGMRSSAL